VKKLFLIILVVFLNVGFQSCTPQALTNDTNTPQACCDEEGDLPPPPPPPPPPEGGNS